MKLRLLLTAALVSAALACGGASQTTACKNFLACEAALGVSADGGTIASTDNATYGPNGTCWISSAVASGCDSTCKTQLNDLKSLPGFSAIPACNAK
ncbi:MAG: hypothetical protein JST54_29875 [Deltaproteobacteria bacterium]|nr:hypothetical protein [Deltaproteobacteria bacterium]